MLFNSIEFLIFFPIVVLGYFLLPFKHRWALLLFASYFFYMCWKPMYIVLIFISTLIVYVTGIKISETEDDHIKRRYLAFSLISNLSILFLFKYFNFFNASLESLFTALNITYNVPSFSLMLPVGISFYTFQALSYTIDVYRGQTEAQDHFGIFALYVSFFPQLVAGPIERSDKLLPQFDNEYSFDYDRVTLGLKTMAWGFFKKVVVADRIATLVNTVYNNPVNYTGFPLILATLFFAIQIYCDFSGYSDIAIGAAQVMGFELMENFKTPYFSTSIGGFWKRWHISLSSWFRDYVYIPLGGNRVSKVKWYRNLMLTFLLSGLWHGANWTFVIWGLIHGFYQVFGTITRKYREKFADVIGLSKLPSLHKAIQVLITFLLVCFAWIFFRANNVSDAIYIINNLFIGLLGNNLRSFFSMAVNLGLSKSEFIISVGSIIVLLIVDLNSFKKDIFASLSKRPLVLRWSVYFALVFSILLFGAFGYTEFIYFQF